MRLDWPPFTKLRFVNWLVHSHIDPLDLLPQKHEIFRSLHTITRVKYTPTLMKDKGEQLQGRAILFGAKVGGRTAVLYSPYDIEGGWNEVRYPLCRGYQSKSAKQLGCNIIMYAMEH